MSFNRCKFDSDANKEALSVLMKEIKIANPEFQTCHIRGKHGDDEVFTTASTCMCIRCLFSCSLHILPFIKSRGIFATPGKAG